MTPYFIFYSIIIGLTFLSFFLNETWKNRAFYFALIILFLFIGFRDEMVGTDTSHYVGSFLHPEMGYGENETDPGFSAVLYILHFFSESPVFFISVVSLLYCAGLFFMIKNNSVNRMMSVVLFTISGTSNMYFFLYLSGIRQALALSCFFVGIYYWIGNQKQEVDLIKKMDSSNEDESTKSALVSDNGEDVIPSRNTTRSIIGFIGAFSIHATSFVTIPLLFISSYLNFSRFIWAIIIVLSYVVGVQSFINVQDLILQLFSIFGNSLPNFIEKYSSYGVAEFGQYKEMPLLNPNMWPYTLIALLLILKSDKYYIQSRYTILFLISVVLNNLFNDNIMWSRLFMYYSMFVIFVTPNILELKKDWLTYCSYGVIVFYFVYKTFAQLFSIWILQEGNVVVPYVSTLFPSL